MPIQPGLYPLEPLRADPRLRPLPPVTRAPASSWRDRAAILGASQEARQAVAAPAVREVLDALAGGPSDGHDGPVLGGHAPSSWDGDPDVRFAGRLRPARAAGSRSGERDRRACSGRGRRLPERRALAMELAASVCTQRCGCTPSRCETSRARASPRRPAWVSHAE